MRVHGGTGCSGRDSDRADDPGNGRGVAGRPSFFPRHLADERYTASSRGSRLLHPQLLEDLPGHCNIVRFQQRFELEPYEEPEGLDADVEVLRFVFRTLTTPFDQLPRRTASTGSRELRRLGSGPLGPFAYAFGG